MQFLCKSYSSKFEYSHNTWSSSQFKKLKFWWMYLFRNRHHFRFNCYIYRLFLFELFLNNIFIHCVFKVKSICNISQWGILFKFVSNILMWFWKLYKNYVYIEKIKGNVMTLNNNYLGLYLLIVKLLWKFGGKYFKSSEKKLYIIYCMEHAHLVCFVVKIVYIGEIAKFNNIFQLNVIKLNVLIKFLTQTALIFFFY